VLTLERDRDSRSANSKSSRSADRREAKTNGDKKPDSSPKKRDSPRADGQGAKAAEPQRDSSSSKS